MLTVHFLAAPDVVAAGIELPWPLVWLAGLVVTIGALGSAIAILRSNTVQGNLTLLRNEKNDYKEAAANAKQQRDEAEADAAEVRETLRLQIEMCNQERKEFTAKLDTLSSVVSGGAAVREGVELILTAQTVAQRELLMEISGMRQDSKMMLEAFLKAVVK